MTSLNAQQRTLAENLKNIKMSSLGLTKHSRASLKRTVSAIDYYLDIYRNCLDKVLELCQLSPSEMTIVDYGGGHGILSIFAKRLGFGRVVYIDNHPDSLETLQVLSDRLGSAPDVTLKGDANTLKKWCEEQNAKPNALLAMDVIEHIYILDEFFATMHDVSPQMQMVFTTASNPSNKRVVRRLHQAMQKDEKGSSGNKGFYGIRRDYLLRLYPDMSDTQLDYWATNTRGLVLDDIARAVESQSPNLLLDSYNTCDPVTGSWTERILPVDDYRHLLQPYGYGLTVLPGRYNEYRRGLKGIASRRRNKTIDKSPLTEPSTRRERRAYKKALKVAPFIYLLATIH